MTHRKSLVILSRASVTQSGMLAGSKEPYLFGGPVLPQEILTLALPQEFLAKHRKLPSKRDPSTPHEQRFACSRPAQDDNVRRGCIRA